MKIHKLIGYIISLIPLCSYSQFNEYTQEWVEERDNIIYDNHSAGAGAAAARKSLWSLSQGSSNWVRPTYSRSQGFSTEKAENNQKVRINTQNRSTKKVSNKSSRSSGRKKPGNYITYTNCRRNREQWIENEEKKRQKLREQQQRNIMEDNMRSQAAERAHLLAKEPYYQEKRKWDFSNKERKRAMDNAFPAESFIDVPSRNNEATLFNSKSSGKDLAALFDEPTKKMDEIEYGINYIEYEEFTRNDNNTFSPDAIIDPFNNLDVDEEDYMRWSSVMTTDDCIIKEIKHGSKPEHEIEEITDLINSNEIETDNGINVTRFLLCGERVFFKDKNRIMEMKDSIEVFMELSLENFEIYPHTDSTFFLAAQDYELAIVNDVNINSRTYNELIKVPIVLTKIISNGDITLISTPDRIINFIGPDNIKLFWKSDIRINDICFCKDGILIATEKAIYICESENNSYVYLETGVKNIWADQEHVYAKTENNIICISKK